MSLILHIKGKRTKRQRSVFPYMNVEAVTGVCSGEQSLETKEEEVSEVEFREGTTDEDQDIANCLMLLSQGHKEKSIGDYLLTQKIGFLRNKKLVGSLGLGLGQDGVYECTTCDKSFKSFQALGGHKASHKKVKLGESVFKRSAFVVETVESGIEGSFLSLQVNSSDGIKKPKKTHECSICKAEFSSGQALGGHMRRHRGLTINTIATSTIRTTTTTSLNNHEESIHQKMQLDLNLPAQEDESKLAFASKDQLLLFAATSISLIDCHY